MFEVVPPVEVSALSTVCLVTVLDAGVICAVRSIALVASGVVIPSRSGDRFLTLLVRGALRARLLSEVGRRL